MRWFWGLLIGLGLGWAQTWYYEVPTNLTPANVYFRPSMQDMLCAAVLAPPTGGGSLSLSTLPRPVDCPASPPVVVFGQNSDGDPVYEINLEVKFWGDRSYQDQDTGVKALVQLLESGYTYRIQVKGDLGKVNAEYAPPFTRPSTDPLPQNGSWQRFASQQDIRLGDPEVKNPTNHYFTRVCRDLFRNWRCWSVTLVWALPVRSVLQGGETGNPQITLTPEYIHAPARTLRASPSGRLRWSGEVKPFTR